jgi:hypothetical protein
MKVVAISLVSWLAGLASYLGSLRLLWGQRISEGDLWAVVFWSAVASVFAVSAAYAPAMFALQRRAATLREWWLFPLAGIALGVVPVLLIVILFQGNPSSFVSPEAILFHCMFAAFGAVFGTGFYWAYGRRRV